MSVNLPTHQLWAQPTEHRRCPESPHPQYASIRDQHFRQPCKEDGAQHHLLIDHDWRSRKEGMGLPGGSVIKNPPSDGGTQVRIPWWGTKISHAAGQLSLLTEPEKPAHRNEDPAEPKKKRKGWANAHQGMLLEHYWLSSCLPSNTPHTPRKWRFLDVSEDAEDEAILSFPQHTAVFLAPGWASGLLLPAL